MIEQSFYEYLSDIDDLTAIVDDRIFPSTVVPQETVRPYLTFECIGGQYTDHLSKPTGFAEHVFQVDSWADSILLSNQIAEIVRLKLHGYMGTMGDDEIAYISILEERNLNEAPQSDNERWLYRRMIRYMIKHRVQIGDEYQPLPGNLIEWGADGEDGLSAYELAVQDGFVGDVGSWLDSLVGPPGATGSQGIQGETGATGATGATGSFSGSSSDSLAEGSTNLYYTTARAALKQDAPIRSLCTSDFTWSTTLTDQTWSPLTIPSTGTWYLKLVLLNSTTTSQTLTPRIVIDTAAISGATGTVVGTGGVSTTAATITTGSPTVIGIVGGAGTSTGRVFEFVIDVTTAGSIKLQIAHNNGGGGLKTCKGSYLEARKLA